MKKLLHEIAQTIYDKKGFNILGLDVREISFLTDYFIIAEGNVERHVISLHEAIIETLQKHGEKPMFIEGEQIGDWIVIDYGWVIIHLFTPEMRDIYRLEELWRASSIVDLGIVIAKDQRSGNL